MTLQLSNAQVTDSQITLFAQPYDITASGFYFTSASDYAEKAALATNTYGQPVEIQFIDGPSIDAQLFSALSVGQVDIEAFLEAVDNWAAEEKVRVIIAVGEVGYTFSLGSDEPGDFDIDLYEGITLRDLAQQFVDEGLYGDIPESIRYYIDYDALARDLGTDYSETEIDGVNYVYRYS